jgi:hypothetical protein
MAIAFTDPSLETSNKHTGQRAQRIPAFTLGTNPGHLSDFHAKPIWHCYRNSKVAPSYPSPDHQTNFGSTVSQGKQLLELMVQTASVQPIPSAGLCSSAP